MEVYADGGVRRGNHVIILLALGARAVGLGRSPMFANVWGEEGVLRMIEILKAELETSMQLMGESKVRNINSSYVSFLERYALSEHSDHSSCRSIPSWWMPYCKNSQLPGVTD